MRFNIFQKILVSVGLLAFVVLLAGCPFSSSVPIDEGTVKVPSELEGQWISVADTEAVNPNYFVITKDDKLKATVKKMEFSSSDSTYSTITYHLTFSEVKDETFMNAIEEGGATYSLYKFRFDEKEGKIYTSEVTDYIKETFATSKELKDFIAKNMSNSYFYTNSDETYVRK